MIVSFDAPEVNNHLENGKAYEVFHPPEPRSKIFCDNASNNISFTESPSDVSAQSTSRFKSIVSGYGLCFMRD